MVFAVFNNPFKSPSKYQLIFDLVNKSRELILKTRDLTNIRANKDKSTLKCILDFEQEFNKYTSKSSDKAIEALLNIIKDIAESKLVQINAQKLELSPDLKEQLNKFELLSQLPNSASLTGYGFEIASLNNIQQIIQNNNIKLKEALLLIFKLDIDFYTKIRHSLLQSLSKSVDIVLNTFKLQIKAMNYSSVIKSFILLFEFQRLALQIKTYSNCIFKFIIQELESFLNLTVHTDAVGSTRRKDKVIEDYNEELESTNKELSDELIARIGSLTEQAFEELGAISAIHEYIEFQKFTIELSEKSVTLVSSNKNVQSINDFCSQIEKSKIKTNKQFYIRYFQMLEDSLKSSLTKEPFEFLSTIESKFAESVELLTKKETFNSLVASSTCDVQQREVPKTESNQVSSTESNKCTEAITQDQQSVIVRIKDKSYKVIASTAETVIYFNELLQLILNFPQDFETVFGYFAKSIKSIAYVKREYILDGKGVGSNFEKVTKTHIIALVSDLNFIKSLFQEFLGSLPAGFCEDFAKEIFNEFKISLDNIVIESKSVLFELYKDL